MLYFLVFWIIQACIFSNNFLQIEEQEKKDLEINVIRNSSNEPNITINKPSMNGVYGESAPEFNISIEGSDLHSRWYTIFGGSKKNFFAGTTGTINQDAWDVLFEGITYITFYVNNTASDTGNKTVYIYKDTIVPNITINDPVNSKFGRRPPEYNISIVDKNLEAVWYTIDGGATNITIANTTGIIKESIWNVTAEGSVTLIFYALDKAGNIGSKNVTFSKELFVLSSDDEDDNDSENNEEDTLFNLLDTILSPIGLIITGIICTTLIIGLILFINKQNKLK